MHCIITCHKVSHYSRLLFQDILFYVIISYRTISDMYIVLVCIMLFHVDLVGLALLKLDIYIYEVKCQKFVSHGRRSVDHRLRRDVRAWKSE